MADPAPLSFETRGGGGAGGCRIQGPGPAAPPCAPAAPAPRPSLRNQFSSSGLWPVACCVVPVFQSLPPWLGSGLWDQGFGFWALSPGVTSPLESGVRVVACIRCSVFGLTALWACFAGAGLAWPHSLHSVVTSAWRARGSSGQRSAGLVAATNPGELLGPRGGSMVGSDRLNVPAIDNSSH